MDKKLAQHLNMKKDWMFLQLMEQRHMDVYRDGVEVGSVDFDKERDRALLDGYELPIHRKMLSRA